MRTLFRTIALLVTATLGCSGATHTSMADDKIGVVMMHGKAGSPRGPISALVRKLTSSGFLVEASQMPWSRKRFLAKDYNDSMAEIDAAVARLKRRGATRIVVGGHSMGGAAAIGYGARRNGLAGVIAISPGHDPGLYGFQKATHFDFNRARTMVQKGRGEAYGRFSDTNNYKPGKVRVKARIYLDWYDPDGPAAMHPNAKNLKPGTPFLCIYGKSEKLLHVGRPNACDPAPRNPKSQFLLVRGGHMNSPRMAAPRIMGWLNDL